jgi:hypothetical protein
MFNFEIRMNLFYILFFTITLLAIAILGYTYYSIRRARQKRYRANNIYQKGVRAALQARDDGKLYSLLKGQYSDADSEHYLDSPNELSAATHALMWWTSILACATIFMAFFAYLTFDAIRGQLNVMETEKRPWIYSVLTNAGPITWTSEKHAQIRFQHTMKNTGGSPAINVIFEIGGNILTKDNLFNSVPEQLVMCERARKRAKSDIHAGQTLFPDEIKIGSGSINEPNDFVRAWPNPNNVEYRIVGCVDYTFATLPGGYGQTAFSYDITRKNDQGLPTGFIPGEVISTDKINFGIDFFHGVYLK